MSRNNTPRSFGNNLPIDTNYRNVPSNDRNSMNKLNKSSSSIDVGRGRKTTTTPSVTVTDYNNDNDENDNYYEEEEDEDSSSSNEYENEPYPARNAFPRNSRNDNGSTSLRNSFQHSSSSSSAPPPISAPTTSVNELLASKELSIVCHGYELQKVPFSKVGNPELRYFKVFKAEDIPHDAILEDDSLTEMDDAISSDEENKQNSKHTRKRSSSLGSIRTTSSSSSKPNFASFASMFIGYCHPPSKKGGFFRSLTMRKPDVYRVLPLHSTYTSLTFGDGSPIFEKYRSVRSVTLPPREYCLSILGRTRSIDIVCSSAAQAQEWYNGLTIAYELSSLLAQTNSNLSRSVPSNPTMNKNIPGTPRRAASQNSMNLNDPSFVGKQSISNTPFKQSGYATPGNKSTSATTNGSFYGVNNLLGGNGPTGNIAQWNENDRQNYFRKTLFDAVRSRNYDDVILAFTEGCDPTMLDPIGSGDNALTLACRVGASNIVRVCLDANVPFMPSGFEGPDALQIAVQGGSLGCVQELVDTAQYTDGLLTTILSRQDNITGNTPLHYCCTNGFADILQYLLSKSGNEILVRNKKGQTPLHCLCASVKGNIDNGNNYPSKNIRKPSNRSMNNIDFAQCVRLLIDYGAEFAFSWGDNEGNSPLHCAVRTNNVTVVNMLLEASCNPLIKNPNTSHSPYEVAVKHNHTECISILQQYIDMGQGNEDENTYTEESSSDFSSSTNVAAYSQYTNPNYGSSSSSMVNAQYGTQSQYANNNSSQSQQPQGICIYPWQQGFDWTNDGYPYWYNLETGESSWEAPPHVQMYLNALYGGTTDTTGTAVTTDDASISSSSSVPMTGTVPTVGAASKVSHLLSTNSDAILPAPLPSAPSLVTVAAKTDDPFHSSSTENILSPHSNKGSKSIMSPPMHPPPPSNGTLRSPGFVSPQASHKTGTAANKVSDTHTDSKENNDDKSTNIIRKSKQSDGKEMEHSDSKYGDNEERKDNDDTRSSKANEKLPTTNSTVNVTSTKPVAPLSNLSSENTSIPSVNNKIAGSLQNALAKQLANKIGLPAPPPMVTVPSTGVDQEGTNQVSKTITPLPVTASSSVGFSASVLQDDNIIKYTRMIRMGVPIGGTVQAMYKAGIDSTLVSKFQDEVNKYLQNGGNPQQLGITTPSVTTDISALSSTPSMESIPASSSSASTGSSPDAQKEAQTAIAADPKFEKFIKMKKMGVPLGAIRAKMTGDNISNEDQKLFLLAYATASALESMGLASPKGKGKETSSDQGITPSESSSSSMSATASTTGKPTNASVLPAAAMARRLVMPTMKLHWDPLRLDETAYKRSLWGRLQEKQRKNEQSTVTVSESKEESKESERQSSLSTDTELASALGLGLATDDLTMLETMFASKGPSATAKITGKNTATNPSDNSTETDGKGPVTKITLLDFKRANNLNIALAQFRRFANHTAIITSVFNFDESTLPREMLEKLSLVLPGSDDIQAIKRGINNPPVNGKVNVLMECDQWFLKVSSVPRFQTKVQAFTTKLSYTVIANDIVQRATILRDACQRVMNSERLADILAAVLSIGNALNVGAAHLEATAISLDSLLKLSTTKGADKKTTLMDALVMVAEKRDRSNTQGELFALLSWYVDIEGINQASRVDMNDVRNEFTKLKQSITAASNEATMEEKDTDKDEQNTAPSNTAPTGVGKKPDNNKESKEEEDTPLDPRAKMLADLMKKRNSSSSTTEPSVPTTTTPVQPYNHPCSIKVRRDFVSNVRSFSTEAMDRLQTVERTVTVAEQSAADLAHYFGEDPRKTPPGKVFAVLTEFASNFNSSLAAIKRKRAAEARASVTTTTGSSTTTTKGTVSSQSGNPSKVLGGVPLTKKK